MDEYSSGDDEDEDENDRGAEDVVVAVWPVACSGCAAVVRSVAEQRLVLAGYPPADPKGKGKLAAALRQPCGRVYVGEGGHAAVRLELWGSHARDEEALVVGRALAADLRAAGFTSAEVVPHSDAAPLLPTPSRPSSLSPPPQHAVALFFSVQV
jgi:hypothetical protein